MAVATILDIWTFPTVDPDDLHSRVIPLFECLRVGNPFMELFVRILGINQGQTRSQMLNYDT